MKRRILLGWSCLAMLCSATLVGVGIPRPAFPAPMRSVRPRLVSPPLGNLLLSRSLYTGTASTVTVGQTLPGGGTAVADGTYPGVFNNAPIDGSFGVTSPIFIDRNALVGTSPLLVSTLAIPTDQVVTSFSSKSEMSLHRSTAGGEVTLMGYVAPVNALDVSNSNVPNHVDPTNPVALAYPRAVIQIDSYSGNTVTVTPVYTYSGNNGRSAILDSTNHQYLMTGNAGNGGSPEPVNIVSNTGVQLVAVGGGPESTVVGIQQGIPGAAKGFQYGFAVQLLGNPADKSGKDDNYRGLTIFDSTLYVTKGSGGNGINTVYQVGTPGTLPTAATAATTPIGILPGFSTTLASSKTGTILNPFGLWFADANTLYVADEGSGSAGANPNAGLQKWVLSGGTWTNVYTLQNGLGHGVSYAVPGLGAALSPATDGIRSLTGRNNGDGTVTLFAVTSTVSASGDQGADPNRLVTITDTLSFQTAADASAEAFTVLKTAGFGEVLRGVEFIPLGADQYVSQLVRAALDTLLALPGSEFKGRHERRELARLLREILDAIEDHRDENAESRLRRALGDLKGIKDDAAEDAIEADLKAALGAIPEGRGDRDE